MPGPPVLLSSYAACVISCGTGVLSSLSSFRGCLSGSSELGWGSVELLRKFDVRVFFSDCFVLASASTRRFWVFHVSFFQWLFFRERGGLSFAFVTVLVSMCSGPSLAPRLAGFAVPARPTRDNRNGRTLYPVRAVRCSWSAWAAHRQRCEPFMLPQVVA